MPFGAVTVQGDNPVATLLVAAGEGPVQVVNNDPNNTLYLGDNASIAASDQHVTPLSPLTPVTFNGNDDVYGVAAPGQTVAVLLYPSAIGWTPSAAQIINQLTLSTLPTLIAQAVQSAGVPPIDNPAIVYINLGSDLPASPGTFTTGHINLSKYQSYAFILRVGNGHNNVNTVPYVRITFNWSLASDNYDPVRVEDWVVPVAPFSFFFTYPNYGSGPCYTDTLDIVFSSYDTVIDTMILAVFGSYRARSRSIIRGQYNWLPGGGADETKGLGSDAMLAMISGTNLAAGTSSTPQLVNLWHGNAALYLTSEDAAIDDLEIHIRPQPSGSLPNDSDIVLSPDGGGLTSLLTGIILPRRVCTIFAENQGNITIPSWSASLVMEGVTE